MRIAILADIHANVEALEAVLIAAEKAGADRFFVLGDVVGYGVDPAACIHRLRELEVVGVLGNHDQAVIDLAQLKGLNPLARESLLEVLPSLGPEEKKFLRSLVLRYAEFGGVFAHANPIRPEEWQPLFLFDHIVWCLQRLDWKVGFVGHTHHPGIFCKVGSQVVTLTSPEVIIGKHQYLVNPGSVGQPRDRDWRAAFAVWDLDRSLVQLHRVEYPVQRTQEKLTQAGWPAYLVERLAQGE